MKFTTDDVRANYEYFAHILKAEKQRNDVLKAVDAASLILFCSTRVGGMPSQRGTSPVLGVFQNQMWRRRCRRSQERRSLLPIAGGMIDSRQQR